MSPWKRLAVDKNGIENEVSDLVHGYSADDGVFVAIFAENGFGDGFEGEAGLALRHLGRPWYS